jgi:DNA-binding NtrC family response regulator
MVMTVQPQVYANEAPSRNLPRQCTILLVEDEPFVRQATCSILESAGFEVLPAKDARDAMKIYEGYHHQINLVMTDMVMPGPSGEQLSRDIHEHSPKIMVLITSGYGNPEYETESPASHTYFLAKPYSRRTLVDKIEKILGVPPLARATQLG